MHSPFAAPSARQLSMSPVADPAAVVAGPGVRFTVLTSRLIRMEHSPDERFEDRASQVFWRRRLPTPRFEVARSPQEIVIDTGRLRLRYRTAGRGFAASTLSVELIGTGRVWRYGDRDRENLLGTARTLDDTDGAARMEPGLMSRAGWAVVDDSRTWVFDDDGWLAARRGAGALDLYFFGCGHDYRGCLADFCAVAGNIPLVPRWALGNWWSRYWAYSQAELAGLMAEFRAREIPLSVCIVDMDWHITRTGNACSGWTGYTWNRDLFPDPGSFLAWLHSQGLKVGLNLHPAEGIHPHEAQYPEMARRMGVAPASGAPVPFDIADPAFARAYFEVLHHPMEAEGVDFWWMDWQQGAKVPHTARPELADLDPLWWLNHLHFHDLGRGPARRPFIFSRWGGLGNHRYQIGFSGDTFVTWKSLAFQPYFTATAANVAYGWWSHDIGGHWRGIEDPELYVRWVQYGILSPIFRLHSTNNPYHERRPWGYDAEVERIVRDALQLRHALIPYIYTMARRAAVASEPLCQPMYYLYPEAEEAYRCPNQYAFGSELLAAPYVAPRDPDTQLSRQTVWLPDGEWFDFNSGQCYAGGRWQAFYGALEDTVLLAQAGAIVPLGPRAAWGGVANPAELTVHIFAGADGRFDLYEDDGESQAYLEGGFAATPFRQSWRDDSLELRIGPAAGDLAQIPAPRTYRVAVHGIGRPEVVKLAVDGAPRPVGIEYDAAGETVLLGPLALRPTEALTLTLAAAGTLRSRRDRRPEACRRLLKAFRFETETKRRVHDDLPKLLAESASLQAHAHALKDAQLAALAAALEASNSVCSGAS